MALFGVEADSDNSMHRCIRLCYTVPTRASCWLRNDTGMHSVAKYGREDLQSLTERRREGTEQRAWPYHDGCMTTV